MTEQEWLKCDEPQTLLFVFVRDEITNHKLRLVACGMARREGEPLRDERSQRAVAISEQYADELVNVLTLSEAEREAEMASNDRMGAFCVAFDAARGKRRTHIKTTMPEVAATQAACCTNKDILSHCRSNGSHVKGCWALDLLLSKE